MAAPNRKTLTFTISVWANPSTGHIHLAGRAPGEFISTISPKPGLRYHPNLYGKLARVLQEAGLWPEGMPGEAAAAVTDQSVAVQEP